MDDQTPSSEFENENGSNLRAFPGLNKAMQKTINQFPEEYAQAYVDAQNVKNEENEAIKNKVQRMDEIYEKSFKALEEAHQLQNKLKEKEHKSKIKELKNKQYFEQISKIKNKITTIFSSCTQIQIIKPLAMILRPLSGILAIGLLTVCCYFLVKVSQDFYMKHDNGLVSPLLQALVLELAPFILIFVPITKMKWMKNLLIGGLVVYNLTITIAPQLTPFLKESVKEYQISKEVDSILARKQGEVAETMDLKKELLEVDHVTSAKKIHSDLEKKRITLDKIQEKKIERLEQGKGLEWLGSLDIISVCFFRVFSIFIAFLLTHNLKYFFKKEAKA